MSRIRSSVAAVSRSRSGVGAMSRSRIGVAAQFYFRNVAVMRRNCCVVRAGKMMGRYRNWWVAESCSWLTAWNGRVDI